MPLAAVCLLVINDHWLKGAGILPGPITGKLSDVAGLFFFPILLFVLLRGVWQLGTHRRFPRRVGGWAAAVATAAGFALIKTSAGVNEWVESWWGHFVMDPTDLLCLPICLLSVAWLGAHAQGHNGRRPARIAQFAAVLLAAGATMATPPPPQRNFPHWQLQAPSEQTIGGLELQAWDAKSGKTGLGVMIRAQNHGDAPRTFDVRSARLELFRDDPAAVVQRVAAAPPQPVVVGAGKADTVYLPFVFDNEAAWNQHIRQGRLVLQVRVDDKAPVTWTIPAAHILEEWFIPYRRATERSKPTHPTEAE